MHAPCAASYSITLDFDIGHKISRRARVHFGKWLKRFECQNLIRLIRSMVGWLASVLFLAIFRWFFSYGPIMK